MLIFDNIQDNVHDFLGENKLNTCFFYGLNLQKNFIYLFIYLTLQIIKCELNHDSILMCISIQSYLVKSIWFY